MIGLLMAIAASTTNVVNSNCQELCSIIFMQKKNENCFAEHSDIDLPIISVKDYLKLLEVTRLRCSRDSKSKARDNKFSCPYGSGKYQERVLMEIFIATPKHVSVHGRSNARLLHPVQTYRIQ